MRRVPFTVLLIVTVLLAVSAGLGAVSAQQDTEPVAFEGTVEDADGNQAPDGTTIVAIPENGTSGETTTEAGNYGGEFDSLTVGANDSETVTVRFYVDDADGPEADESPETFDVEQGQHTHDLTFPAGTFESSGDDDDDDDGSDDSSTGGPAGGTDDGTDDDDDDDDSTDDDSVDDDTDVDDEDDTDVEDDDADDEADDETAESDDEDDDTAIEADDGEEEPVGDDGDDTDETDGAVDDETDDEAPGFGIGAALIALSGLFVFARRLGPSRSTE